MNQNMKLSGKLYGITHDLDGTPRITEPTVIKVSIGLTKGKAIHVYINHSGKWVIQTGIGRDANHLFLDSKEEAIKKYYELKPKVEERKYPDRLQYYTFSHLVPSGEYEPDFDVIEAHGPMPEEIEISFIWDEPFNAEYQLWTASELKCKGDGRDAFRINTGARSTKEKEYAAQAEEQGEKYFPIAAGCSEYGCPYCKPQGDKPAICHPVGTLKFQLINSPRLGGTVSYKTTSYRSIRQIFSSIEILKIAFGIGGHITGVPLTMVLSSYGTRRPDGKKATQYCVNLEFRESSAVGAARKFLEYSSASLISIEEAQKQLALAPDPAESAAAIDAEFDTSETNLQEPEPTEQEPDGIPELSPEELISREASEFYVKCRKAGMTDTIILEHIGRMDYETPAEIPLEAIPDLVKWAEEWKPGGTQTSLI